MFRLVGVEENWLVLGDVFMSSFRIRCKCWFRQWTPACLDSLGDDFMKLFRIPNAWFDTGYSSSVSHGGF